MFVIRMHVYYLQTTSNRKLSWNKIKHFIKGPDNELKILKGHISILSIYNLLNSICFHSYAHQLEISHGARNVFKNMFFVFFSWKSMFQFEMHQHWKENCIDKLFNEIIHNYFILIFGFTLWILRKSGLWRPKLWCLNCPILF